MFKTLHRGSGQGPVADPYGDGIESLCSTKDVKFLDNLSDY